VHPQILVKPHTNASGLSVIKEENGIHRQPTSECQSAEHNVQGISLLF
jgi:hypothetical protein